MSGKKKESYDELLDLAAIGNLLSKRDPRLYGTLRKKVLADQRTKEDPRPKMPAKQRTAIGKRARELFDAPKLVKVPYEKVFNTHGLFNIHAEVSFSPGERETELVNPSEIQFCRARGSVKGETIDRLLSMLENLRDLDEVMGWQEEIEQAVSESQEVDEIHQEGMRFLEEIEAFGEEFADFDPNDYIE